PVFSSGYELPRIYLSQQCQRRLAQGQSLTRTVLTPIFIGMIVIPVPLASLRLLSFILAIFGPFLGALAMSGTDFALELELRSRLERSHFPQTAHHLDAFPDAHLRHLPHQGANLVKLAQELLDFMGLCAAACSNPPPAADVDDVGVTPFLLRHR